MKYVVEINDETTKGAQLINYIEQLKAPKKAVLVRREKALIDEEMGFPGLKPSKAQLDAWLKPREDEKGIPLDKAIDSIKKRLIAKSKRKK